MLISPKLLHKISFEYFTRQQISTMSSANLSRLLISLVRIDENKDKTAVVDDEQTSLTTSRLDVRIPAALIVNIQEVICHRLMENPETLGLLLSSHLSCTFSCGRHKNNK